MTRKRPSLLRRSVSYVEKASTASILTNLKRRDDEKRSSLLQPRFNWMGVKSFIGWLVKICLANWNCCSKSITFQNCKTFYFSQFGSNYKWCWVISSTGHFVYLSFCQLVILSTCHFVNWSFCLLVILSTCPLANLSFCQLVL